MTTAHLVLDYIRTLIWPALVVFVVFRFRGSIGGFLGRIAGESQEFSASAFGLGITAKFQEQLVTLAEQSDTADPDALRESLKETARSFSAEQFSALTADFASSPIQRRRELAATLAELTENMEIDDLLTFARSSNAGARTGAAIGIRTQLRLSPQLAEDSRIGDALGALLKDKSSLVRYRAADALRAAPMLAAAFEDELRALADEDRNAEVRSVARRALPRARL